MIMSEVVSVSHDGLASTVTMTQPPFNLLDPEFMDALVAAHKEADAHPDTRVVVTRSGLDGMFSNGLNPMLVLDTEPSQRVKFFEAVSRLIEGLYTLEKPHIAVCNGPAMAGGAVLAILADYRYMDEIRGRLCFAETKVGVPIPEPLVNIIRAVCMPSHLRDVVLMAKNMSAGQALEAGLVDGIAMTDELDALVQKQIERIGRLSGGVLKATKRGIRAPIIRSMHEGAGAHLSSDFAQFCGDEYLGEGLRAFMEGRPPVYAK